MEIIGESSRLPRTTGIYHVDFRVPIPLRHKDNPFTVRRP